MFIAVAHPDRAGNEGVHRGRLRWSAYMLTRFVKRYIEYRRVGLTGLAAIRPAWMVAAAGVPVAGSDPPAA